MTSLTVSCSVIGTRIKNECPILMELGEFKPQEGDIYSRASKEYIVMLNRTIRDCENEH